MKSPTIGTLASHSALQILWGAERQGFQTVLVTPRNRTWMYQRFSLRPRFVELESFHDILLEEVQKELKQSETVLIPHGTLVGALSSEELLNKLRIPIFGNKKILPYEKEAHLHKKWLEKADVRTPETFSIEEKIRKPVMVKFAGARGGKGYFVSQSTEEIQKRLKEFPLDVQDSVWLQEFIRGVPIYFHFFKHLNGENKLTGIDIRYESDANAFGRIPASIQQELDLRPAFSVVGNIPVVVRESLLLKVFEIADQIIEASKALAPPGLLGPYCVETIITPDLEIIVIEISARIVAGTTAWVPTSPYAEFSYGKSVSVGDIIALEIKNAVENSELDKIIS